MATSSTDENIEHFHHQESQSHNASAEAAGVARGIARSVGTSEEGALPKIGSGLMKRGMHKVAVSLEHSEERLPLLSRRVSQKGNKPPGRVSSVFKESKLGRRVEKSLAKMEERLATRLHWLASALEETKAPHEDSSQSEKQQKSKQPTERITTTRIPAVVTSLLKNTLLATAVFESYAYTILEIASLQQNAEDHDTTGDDFLQAPLAAHFSAGAVGGTVFGAASTAMDVRGASNMIRSLPSMTAHHALGHALLFGSYESIKRAQCRNTKGGDGNIGLLGCGVAGGLAGQIQRVVGHYTEQLCLFSRADPQTRIIAPRTRFLSMTAPTLRPVMAAFLPNAIGFIAFEYGKKFVPSEYI